MKECLNKAEKNEMSPLGKNILGKLKENLRIAAEDNIPICQDTGMAVIFVDIGQDVHFVNGNLTDAINEGVRRGYNEGYQESRLLRILSWDNTGDNTPGHYHMTL